MTTAFVLMTALPPTKGHLHLIQFANELADQTKVIVCSQPSEPYTLERWHAVWRACRDMLGVEVVRLHRQLEQNPEAPGFWDTWQEIMLDYGVQPGDYIVSSEPYGQTLADLTQSIFMPYDPNRQLYYTKATRVREEPDKYFSDIMPTFQRHLRQTVTLFGAESTGKTTLSHDLSVAANGHWLFEYARPYLETVGPDITVESMTGIWKGQAALQRHAATWLDKPWVIQDTDLYSTVGYWDFPHWQSFIGSAPDALRKDALDLKSDLYLVTKSNIPYEVDPIRYGGDHREGTDEYWLEVCEKNRLNYRIITSDDRQYRLAQALDFMDEHWKKVTASITYDRQGY